MFHFVESAVHGHAENMVMALDVINAFNSMSHTHIMDEVARKFLKLLDTASLVLSQAQKHYLYDGDGKAHTVSAASGVDQGDPLSAVLFMIGMIRVMLAVNRRTPDPHIARFAAYVDDWLIVVRTAGIPGFMAVAEEELAKVGLQLNKTKTHFWQPPADECVQAANTEADASTSSAGTRTGLPADLQPGLVQ